MLKTNGFLFCLLIGSFSVFAQEIVPAVTKKKKPHGTFYGYWGYNRDWYSKSTISFENHRSDNYAFTFVNAHANDKPDFQYIHKIIDLTVPQYNLHLGYFFNDKKDLGIEVSWDHSKYVVNDYQNIHVTGEIRGHQINKDTLVTPSFVHLQHTNGNNYLMTSLVKRFSFVKKKNLKISIIEKLGGGILMSYTISTILGNHDDGYFHYHGWVTGTTTELRMDIYKYFFISTSLQGAFANYTNTKLGADHFGRSTQTFFSLQYMFGAGFNIPIGGRK